MDKNHQDKPGSKPGTIEAKLWRPPLSSKDQEKLNRLHNNQMEDIVKQLRGRGYKVTEEYNDTGQISKVSGEEKTWWDWLQLVLQVIGAIAIPASIVLGVWQFTQQQQIDLQKSINQQQTDLQMSMDQQHQATLQIYLDRMSDLLLVDHLLASKRGDEVRALAEARTLTAIRNLDRGRKGTLIRFLWEAQLINEPQPIIALRHANLNDTILSGAILSGVNLSGANLRGADLSHTTLCGADLSGKIVCADLSQADLSGANLSQANLNCIDKKNCADLGGVIWRGADLSGAYLRGADLGSAYLRGADLSGADLSGALQPHFLNAAIKSLEQG